MLRREWGRVREGKGERENDEQFGPNRQVLEKKKKKKKNREQDFFSFLFLYYYFFLFCFPPPPTSQPGIRLQHLAELLLYGHLEWISNEGEWNGHILDLKILGGIS